jgi:hypothetical protein
MRKFIAVLAAGLITLFYSTAMAATYSALTSSDTQVAKAANTPYSVTMSGDATTGFKVDGSKVTILKAGDYFVIGAAQVGGSTTDDIYLWVRQNGKDVADSNSIQNIPAPAFTTVLVSQGEMTFKSGDRRVGIHVCGDRAWSGADRDEASGHAGRTVDDFLGL